MLTENDRLKGFISDVYSEILERFEEAEKESAENRSDLFNSGRAEAYFEVKDIIESRLKNYYIEIDE